jgi:hypothetical protein
LVSSAAARAESAAAPVTALEMGRYPGIRERWLDVRSQPDAYVANALADYSPRFLGRESVLSTRNICQIRTTEEAAGTATNVAKATYADSSDAAAGEDYCIYHSG